MKYFILAGEKSGDLHGSNLIKEIKQLDSNAVIKAWGGDLMKEAGADVLIHHSELAIMGILGVIQNIQRLKKLFKNFSDSVSAFNPDTIIFIDYGGFNLKAAKIAKLKGFHTQFYIAPKVWAWNKSRISTIKQWIDELYVIFPFEEAIFQKEHISTHYIGNPLNDAIHQFVKNNQFLEQNKIQKPYIALLPGSRKQEILSAMPVFRSLILLNPKYQFVIAGIKEYKDLYQGFEVVFEDTYNLLSNARCAVVTSGTATLETALFEVPQIVVYKTDWLFYSLAKMLIKVKFISLVNIILDRLAVPELIQGEFNAMIISSKIDRIYEDTTERKLQLENYKQLKSVIGNEGASKKAATLMVESARNYAK